MSKHPRFFIDPSQVNGTKIVVTGDDLRHIRTVLRKEPGDLLTLLDGRGAEYTARISVAGRDEILCDVVEQEKHELPGPHITLGQGIAKSDKMDWIVQKVTELGVSTVIPLVTERTIVKVKDEEKRIGRWQKIAREAAMQSRRLDVPMVGEITKFSRFLELPLLRPSLARGEQEGSGSLPSGTLKLLPWEEGTRPLKEVL